jgi:hypothetical protein
MGPLAITINGVLLAAVLGVSVWLLRLGVRYTYEYGRTEIQLRLRWRILIGILILFVLGLGASLFNVLVELLNT